MSTGSAKSYKLSKLDVIIDNEPVDIRELVANYKWYESIDSAFIRCDITILDSINFDEKLLGSEKVNLTFQTEILAGSRIKHQLQIYKIGAVIKQERQKMYILHCASPEIYRNESNRAFGQFGPVSGKTDIVKDMLKKNLKTDKKIHIESHTNINVLSPNWRPVDLIAYMSDKVCRTENVSGLRQGGKGKSQSGFLFWESRDGWNFKSMDSLCEQEPKFTYTYAQSNVGTYDPATNYFKIESIKYPERANQLEKLRSGAYKQCTYGIVMASTTESFIPNPGATSSNLVDAFIDKVGDVADFIGDRYNTLTNSQLKQLAAAEQGDSTFENTGGDTSFTWKPKGNGETKDITDGEIENKERMGNPSGTISGPLVTNLLKTFSKASKLHEGLPYDQEHIKQYLDLFPTRTKFKVLPGYTNQTAASKKGGADFADESILTAATYSAARWALFNTHSLTIKIPGNTKIRSGDVIKVALPSSQQESKDKVKRDQVYSGKYIVKGVIHQYQKQGITTELFLCRGSLPPT